MATDFDARWRTRALQGDASAVARLAQEMLTPLYRFCWYRVGANRHLCEEVVQETLLKALRGLDRYEPERAGGNIFPWLTGLARNEIQRVLAQSRQSASLETLWAKMDAQLREVYARLESDELSEEVLRREETRDMVNATMSQLPPHYREALEEKYLNGRTVREIATALATTEKSVEAKLSRARQAFRETFVALARNLKLEAIG